MRADGFAALAELARRFDGVEQAHPRVPAEALRTALDRPGPAGACRAGRVHRACAAVRRGAAAGGHRRRNRRRRRGDASNGSRWAAWGSTFPGGLAVYPSSVVMNVVPALAAGVASIALASPPQKDFGAPAAPHHPGRGRAAGHRGGLRHRRRAGRCRVRLRRARRRRARPGAGTRGRGHRPRQHLRRHGQAAG